MPAPGRAVHVAGAVVRQRQADTRGRASALTHSHLANRCRIGGQHARVRGLYLLDQLHHVGSCWVQCWVRGTLASSPPRTLASSPPGRNRPPRTNSSGGVAGPANAAGRVTDAGPCGRSWAGSAASAGTGSAAAHRCDRPSPLTGSTLTARPIPPMSAAPCGRCERRRWRIGPTSPATARRRRRRRDWRCPTAPALPCPWPGCGVARWSLTQRTRGALLTVVAGPPVRCGSSDRQPPTSAALVVTAQGCPPWAVVLYGRSHQLGRLAGRRADHHDQPACRRASRFRPVGLAVVILAPRRRLQARQAARRLAGSSVPPSALGVMWST